jgi:hypothetical protein
VSKDLRASISDVILALDELVSGDSMEVKSGG